MLHWCSKQPVLAGHGAVVVPAGFCAGVEIVRAIEDRDWSESDDKSAAIELPLLEEPSPGLELGLGFELELLLSAVASVVPEAFVDPEVGLVVPVAGWPSWVTVDPVPANWDDCVFVTFEFETVLVVAPLDVISKLIVNVDPAEIEVSELKDGTSVIDDVDEMVVVVERADDVQVAKELQ